ncbi:molybdate ABC transporter substrate-binding protein [uncultured Agrococcus sp.]|uniref:molybdate ABC transporter substrate-binding protein n=1 Tax=uncultured Agrococcus sp. TaxID=382258 RepID=UPI0025D63772|nr:molybdate ABC transporter substrate-binding protein [uncultured Agrococcus sp.]
MKRTIGTVSIAALLFALAGCSSGGDDMTDSHDDVELTVFAAASLQAAFDELAEEFAAEHENVTFAPIVYDGSSVLATQLQSGAHADIFATADEANMEIVVDDDLVAGDPITFATNELVTAVAPGNPCGIESLEDIAALQDESDAPVVVMCAQEVPCGTAARNLLELADVSLDVASEEQNVSAVLSRVASGEADVGFVYRTDVQISDGEVEGIEIAGADENPNVYPIALLQGSKEQAAAQEFIDFVLSERGAEILAGYGFGAP